jgi:hypothetical protein
MSAHNKYMQAITAKYGKGRVENRRKNIMCKMDEI